MKKIPLIFLLIALLAITAYPFFTNVKATEFHPDETNWLLESKYFKMIIFDGQLAGKVNGPKDRYWIMATFIDQPPVAKYIFIAASHLLRYKIEAIDLKPWNFTKGKSYNLLHNSVPSKDLLFSYRYITAAFGLFSCLLIFLIGRRISNNYTGILAAVLLAYNPLMISCCTRVMSEGFLIFFICICVYQMILFFESLSEARYPRSLLRCALAAVAVGLATGTKYNGIIASFLFIALCLFALITRIFRLQKEGRLSLNRIFKDDYSRVLVLSVIIFVVLLVLTTIIIDPYLCTDPIPNLRNILLHRLEIVKIQREMFDVELHHVTDRIAYIWENLFSARGEYAPFKNRYSIPLYFMFVLAGALFMIKDEITHIFYKRRCSNLIIILLWLFITLGSLFYLLLVGWDRYLLPLLPPASLLLGYSIGRLYHPHADGTSSLKDLGMGMGKFLKT